MEREEIKNILEKKEVVVPLSSEAEFHYFLKVMEDVDEVKEVKTSSLRLKYVPGGEMPGTNQPLEAEQKGFMIEAEGETYVALDATVQLMANRAGMSCALFSNLLDKGQFQDVCALVNYGFPYAEPDDSSKIFLRAGNVIGVFSDMYQVRPQRDLFENAEEQLHTRFPRMQFVNADYTHELTTVTYSLGNYQDEFFEKFSRAWSQSGYDPNELRETVPLIRISTSDAGMSSVTVVALLKMGDRLIQLSDRMLERHYGITNSNKSFSKKLDGVYAKMQANLDTLTDMMSIHLDHPYEVMIGAMKAGKKHSLASICKKACKECLAEYKLTLAFGGDAEESAFDVYSAIIDMQYSSKMLGLQKGTVANAVEAMYRTISLDWKALDVETIDPLAE